MYNARPFFEQGVFKTVDKCKVGLAAAPAAGVAPPLRTRRRGGCWERRPRGRRPRAAHRVAQEEGVPKKEAMHFGRTIGRSKPVKYIITGGLLLGDEGWCRVCGNLETLVASR